MGSHDNCGYVTKLNDEELMWCNDLGQQVQRCWRNNEVYKSEKHTTKGNAAEAQWCMEGWYDNSYRVDRRRSCRCVIRNMDVERNHWRWHHWLIIQDQLAFGVDSGLSGSKRGDGSLLYLSRQETVVVWTRLMEREIWKCPDSGCILERKAAHRFQKRTGNSNFLKHKRIKGNSLARIIRRAE